MDNGSSEMQLVYCFAAKSKVLTVSGLVVAGESTENQSHVNPNPNG